MGTVPEFGRKVNMDSSVMMQFKDLGVGAVIAFAAMGSALGTGAAGMAAIGAWKKAFAQNKAAQFMLIVFVGAPITQTIYGMIVMNKIAELAAKGSYMWGIGLFVGIPIGLSAWMQGMAGAAAADAMGETGKGFGNYLIVLGVVETVALFVMAFTLGILGKLVGS